MAQVTSVDALLQHLSNQAKLNHRTLCWVRGSEADSEYWINTVLAGLSDDLILRGPSQYSSDKLGLSFPCVIFNAYEGFHPNHFCAMIDCLQGGGILLLQTPYSLEEWLNLPDPEFKKFSIYEDQQPQHRFLTRLFRFLQIPANNILSIDCKKVPITRGLSNHLDCRAKFINQAFTQSRKITPNKAQLDVIHTMLQLVQNKEAFAVSLTANRGRGKSFALCLFITKAFQSCTQNPIRWALCTPKRNQAKWMLNLISDQLLAFGLKITRTKNNITCGNCLVEWCTLENLSINDPEYDVVIVDESASFPIHWLYRLTERYKKLIFATTLIGYEGSGQGYALNFSQYLKRNSKLFVETSLQAPIRWSETDLIEQWLNKAFLFNDPPKHHLNTIKQTKQNSIQIEYINLDNLIQDENKLLEIYSLLRQSHYRTRPGDLRVLLDAPGQHIWASWLDDECIGICWASQDGPIPEYLQDQIIVGERRLKGHLTPQLLAFQLKQPFYLNYKIARIIRIAVSLRHRRKGIGTQLIKMVEAFADEQNWQATATTFSQQISSVKFWEALGYKQVLSGKKIQASSGQRSLTFLKEKT